MLGASNSGVGDSIRESLDFRMKTLRKVLRGRMSPLERRLELAGRRPGVVFGGTKDSLSSLSRRESVERSDSNERSEQKGSGYETADNVEIEIESPSEDQLRVANFLAEKHSEAETIALSSEDEVEIREGPGGTFVVEVSEILDRELKENTEAEYTDASVPSMSTAAAEKLS